MDGIRTENVFASASSRSLQQSGSMRHGDAQPGVPWRKSRVMVQHDLLPTCRWGPYVRVRPAGGLFWLVHVRRGSLIMPGRQLGKLARASCEASYTPVRGTTSVDRGVHLTTVRPMSAGVKTNTWIKPTTGVELEQHGRRRWSCRTGTAEMSNSCPPRG